MRSENSGSAPTHSAASSCSTMAATIGGVPRAAPMPVSPLSVSTNQAPPQVRTRLAPGAKEIRTAGPILVFIDRGGRFETNTDGTAPVDVGAFAGDPPDDPRGSISPPSVPP